MLNMRQAFESETPWAQKRPQIWSPKLWRGAFYAIVRAAAESADGTVRRARGRRFSGRGVKRGGWESLRKGI
eukprot:3480526-Alexandrium_andersonii.AAC.1